MFLSRHLGCVNLLVTVNNAAMNMGVWVCRPCLRFETLIHILHFFQSELSKQIQSLSPPAAVYTFWKTPFHWQTKFFGCWQHLLCLRPPHCLPADKPSTVRHISLYYLQHAPPPHHEHHESPWSSLKQSEQQLWTDFTHLVGLQFHNSSAPSLYNSGPFFSRYRPFLCSPAPPTRLCSWKGARVS